MSSVRVEHHPCFASHYVALANVAGDFDDQLELFGDVTALLNALEEFGHEIEEDNHHPDAISHPIVTSR